MNVKNKILSTVLGLTVLLALVGMLAVNRQYAVAIEAAIKEAENVARVLSFVLSDAKGFSATAQEIIMKLNQVERRDVVLVDTHQLIIADAVAWDIGKNYTEDENDEVGATLKDGKIRTFVEYSADSPLPIKQITLPVRDQAGNIIGAIVLEYTTLHDELMKLTETNVRRVVTAGCASVLLALMGAIYLARSIANPLRQLRRAAVGFASGRTDVPLPPARKDEIGELTGAFHNMVQERLGTENEIRRARDELEIRVDERTAALAKTNEALNLENTERKRIEGELLGKTAFLEAQVNSSIDGILVVDDHGKKALQNQRFVDLLKVPQIIADESDDLTRLHWVGKMCRNSEEFTKKVLYLYEHRDEISRDEMELTDGTVLDRYSSPVLGKDGKYYGRIWTFRDITDRKRTERSLRLFESAVEQAGEAILITDSEIDLPGPRIIFVNPAFSKMTGYTAEEVIGKTPRILQGPLTDKSVLRRLRQNLQRGEVFEGGTINYRKDGKAYDQEWQITPIRDASGKIGNFVALQRDVTGRKQLESRLVQSQKLETVGKLAGGIAHEFNSILTAIIGQSELLVADLPTDSASVKSATEIREAALRAAVLTRQLLAYGRKQILQPDFLDLNRIVANMEAGFHHILGAEVNTQIIPASDLHTVKADAGQIEQVIMNMIVNARDAMPNGGRLTLETANVTLDPEYVSHFPELKAGDYVMLAISDTGAGMPPEVKARVFEPFFSTKGVGEGTGLGLSTCYGIIKQSGGHTNVYSELGRGTTFKIYLPRVDPEVKAPVVARALAPNLPRGTETILLVEDDPALREMAGTLLKRLGYTVLAAANGIEALSLKQQRETGHIDLLFTDVVMPHMSGKELADRIQALYPHTRILFTSAYTENAIVHQGVLNKGATLLQKPFTPSALAYKLREILDAERLPVVEAEV